MVAGGQMEMAIKHLTLKTMKKVSIILTVMLLACAGCELVEGPVFINDTGQSLRLEILHANGNSIIDKLKPGQSVWQGKDPIRKPNPIERIRLTGEDGLKREYQVKSLLADVASPDNAAIIIGRSGVEITTIKDADRRGLLK